jgi:hypothetical protein
MTNPTSNFGWQMPTPTDLVTDLPADFEVFGQAVDTSMADLKGGTTGQILSKATNTDMDFTWITNDVGDITNIAVTSPITGGGSSGSVTIGVSAASTSASGVVQLSDSTSTTSSVLASTPTATKSAYDLADAAIAKSTLTTAGDVLYRNATVPVRLGIGTAGQVLTVNTGATAPEWKAAPATSGPAFIAYASATQTLVAFTNTKRQINTEIIDTDSCFDTSTNRFTPNKAGLYQVNVTQAFNSAPNRHIEMIYKNGVSDISVNDAYTSGNDFAGGGSTLISMNGTTDYLEFYILSTATPIAASGSGNSRFSATWIRSN